MTKRFCVFVLISYFITNAFGKIYNDAYGHQPEKAAHDDLLVMNVNRILDLLERKIPTIEQNINRILDVLHNNKSNELAMKKNEKPNDIQKIIDLYETMNRKLEVVDKKISEKCEENLHLKLDKMEKNILKELEDIKSKSEVLHKVTDLEVDEPLHLDGKENKTLDNIFDVTLTSNISDIMEKTPEEIMFPEIRVCKEVSVSSMRAPTYSMDGKHFKHITTKRNSTGLLSYFEMHIAVEAEERMAIQLSEKENISDSNIRYYIDVGRNNNQYTELQYKSRTLQRIHTPNILSHNEFRTFYIIIKDGILKFGKVGDSRPLISYYDAHFRSVNYFTFGNWIHEARIRYDCPAPFVEELPCREESFIHDSYTSTYSMDNETLNHVTVERNSLGHLTLFEMHIATDADAHVGIKLSDKGTNSDISYYIFIGLESNQYTELYYVNSAKWTSVQRILTPNILSSPQFRDFYIKINDGKLEFGKEGDSSPLLSHEDARFSLFNFFSFYYGQHSAPKIRFDCPAPLKESS